MNRRINKEFDLMLVARRRESAKFFIIFKQSILKILCATSVKLFFIRYSG